MLTACGAHPSDADRADRALHPAGTTLAAPRTAAPAVVDIIPTSLRIPGIDVSTPLVQLGLNDDHTVEVPRDASRAGWFRHGPVPGLPGSSVILGHVDSVHGPAVFYRLPDLERGDSILVRLSDRTIARFVVTRVVTYANENFPAERVYAGTPGRPTLSLVTCGGEYDASAGGYQSNVVVYADHTLTTRSQTSPSGG